MRSWSAERVAAAAGCDLMQAGAQTGGPQRVVIDSREAGPGALFVGLAGSSVHGGSFAAEALAAGCWGVLSDTEHVAQLAGHGGAVPAGHGGAVLAAADPLAALQALALTWRRELGAVAIGVTGSAGKTTTKELLRALLEGHRRVFASAANRNTEIGLPLELLRAPVGTEVLVLEMAMRGRGQIAELCRIAQPDVGVIVSVGPVHLELLGSLEAIAAAKAELIAALPDEGVAVVPAGEPLLEAHLRPGLRRITFGSGGQVSLAEQGERSVSIALSGGLGGTAGERLTLEVSFTQAHLRHDLLAAVAAALAVGVRPGGAVALAPGPGRGQRIELEGPLTLIDDCYNANPLSMRAALADLAAGAPPGRRRVAVLGDMLELGPLAAVHHEALGREAARAGVALLIAVGPLAAQAAAAYCSRGGEQVPPPDSPAPAELCGREAVLAADAAAAAQLVPGLVRAGDVVLVKGSRAVGLEAVCAALADAFGARGAARQPSGRRGREQRARA